MLAEIPFLALALLGPATLTVAPPKADPPSHGHHRPTPRELAELRALAEAERARSRSDRCYAEEARRVGGSPSELDRQAIELKCRRVGATPK